VVSFAFHFIDDKMISIKLWKTENLGSLE
jgi:hypothetical protein